MVVLELVLESGGRRMVVMVVGVMVVVVVLVDGDWDEEGGGVGVEATSFGSRGGARCLCIMDGGGVEGSTM